MKMTWICAALLAATACSKSDAKKDEPKQEEKKEAKKEEPKKEVAKPAGPKSCADYGGTGKGEFGDSCMLKGPAPFKVELTGEYKMDFDREVPVLKITNNFDHETSWGSISLWYYDKDGKVLELTSYDGTWKFKQYNMNGSGVLRAKPGETIEVLTGMEKAKVPPETVAIEAEVTGWGWDGPNGGADGGMYFHPHHDVTDWENRPQGGWR